MSWAESVRVRPLVLRCRSGDRTVAPRGRSSACRDASVKASIPASSVAISPPMSTACRKPARSEAPSVTVVSRISFVSVRPLLVSRPAGIAKSTPVSGSVRKNPCSCVFVKRDLATATDVVTPADQSRPQLALRPRPFQL